MKKYSTLLFLFLLYQSSLFSLPIRYRYDAAGKRTQRLIYVYDPTGEDSNTGNPVRFAAPPKESLIETQEEKEEKEFVSSDFKLLAFPNPAETYINLNILEYKSPNPKAVIRIFDRQGRQLLEQNTEKLNNEIDISNLQMGLYYLQVIIENKRVTYPFEKLAR